MCARFELNQTRLAPGKPVSVWLAENVQGEFVWAGFATVEKLAFWTKRRGGKLVDVPAQRFAERSNRDGRLIWDDVPPDEVIRGLVDPNDGKPVLKIVTRESTTEELQRFEHPRMPMIEKPLFSATPITAATGPTAQLDLF